MLNFTYTYFLSFLFLILSPQCINSILVGENPLKQSVSKMTLYMILPEWKKIRGFNFLKSQHWVAYLFCGFWSWGCCLPIFLEPKMVDNNLTFFNIRGKYIERKIITHKFDQREGGGVMGGEPFRELEESVNVDSLKPYLLHLLYSFGFQWNKYNSVKSMELNGIWSFQTKVKTMFQHIFFLHASVELHSIIN